MIVRWKDLVELFKMIYNTSIYDVFLSFKTGPRKSFFFTIGGVGSVQVGHGHHFEAFVLNILEAIGVV